MKSPEDYIRHYGLAKHPEGGYYKEILRLATQVLIATEGQQDAVSKFSAGTSIYYLLKHETTGDYSAWHKLNGLDEVWHYYAGASLTIYSIKEDGKLLTQKLGLGYGATPQVHIPKDTWFAAVVDGDDPQAFVFVGCTVFPGFDFAKFELGKRDSLLKAFSEHSEIITRFTRQSLKPVRFLSEVDVEKTNQSEKTNKTKNK